MLEEDIFRVIVPLTDQAAAQVTAQDSAQVTEQATEQATEQVIEQAADQAGRIENILRFCVLPRSSNVIMDYLKLTHREHFRAEILKPLLESGKLRLTIPDKPNSPKQKYITTKKAH
jgi:ATP-dependent DNA helicase RecG